MHYVLKIILSQIDFSTFHGMSLYSRSLYSMKGIKLCFYAMMKKTICCRVNQNSISANSAERENNANKDKTHIKAAQSEESSQP